MDFKFNINYSVKVKLTDFGIAILKENHNDLNNIVKENGGVGLDEFNLRLDSDGYYTIQMWCLIRTFGKYIGLGLENPFETEIICLNGESVVVFNEDKKDYKPMCPYGYDDCVHDCNYIKHYYPSWYNKLSSPTECKGCIDGSQYDDEDK